MSATPSDGNGGLERVKGAAAELSPRQQARAQASKILSLRVAGLSVTQIARQLDLVPGEVGRAIREQLNATDDERVSDMRRLENERLDKAQSIIWQRVLQGDEKAIGTYLKISAARSRINGLDAPTRIEIGMNVKHEMTRALENLERLVLGDTVDGEIISESEQVLRYGEAAYEEADLVDDDDEDTLLDEYDNRDEGEL